MTPPHMLEHKIKSTLYGQEGGKQRFAISRQHARTQNQINPLWSGSRKSGRQRFAISRVLMKDSATR